MVRAPRAPSRSRPTTGRTALGLTRHPVKLVDGTARALKPAQRLFSRRSEPHMKLKATVLLTSLVLSGAAFAQTAPESTLSFNVGAVTDYRYRGISQSRLKPALQGGVDYTHGSGFYVGAWASTIKWIKDAGGDADVE